MNIIGALLGAGFGAALLLLVSSLRPTPPRPVSAQVPLGERWARVTRRPPGGAGRRRDLRVGGVVVAAFVVFAVTGWAVVLVIIPAAVLLLPWLLSNPNTAGIATTAALEEWVRSLRTQRPGW